MNDKKTKVVLDRGTKKLSYNEYMRVLELRKKGYSYGVLAEKFNVSRTTVFNYVTGKTSPPKKNE